MIISEVEQLGSAIAAKNIEISDKKTEVDEKESERDNLELDESEYETQHDDMLDELYEAPFNMLPSTILKKCDPIMHNQSLSEFVDSMEISETGEYKALDEKYEELVVELEDLEDELEILEEELENL
jgi:hypothetical protein